MEKLTYERPSLIKLGDVKSLTLNAAGSPTGDISDTDYNPTDGIGDGPSVDNDYSP